MRKVLYRPFGYLSDLGECVDDFALVELGEKYYCSGTSSYY